MQKLVADHPSFAPPDFEELRQKSRQKWLSAAEEALSRNTTTFAVLPVNEVLESDGLIAQLEARGYSVEISAEPLEN
jgi:flavin-binding protein dodecin